MWKGYEESRIEGMRRMSVQASSIALERWRRSAFSDTLGGVLTYFVLVVTNMRNATRSYKKEELEGVCLSSQVSNCNIKSIELSRRSRSE